MPDLVVDVDTQVITNSDLVTEVDTQVLNFNDLGVLVDSRVLGEGTESSLSVLIDTTARKIGAPLGVEVDSITSVINRLGVQTDSQVINRSKIGIFVDSQIVNKKDAVIQVDSEARARKTQSKVVLVDTFVSRPVRVFSLTVDSVAVPTGKIFNPIFISYHYPYPAIED